MNPHYRIVRFSPAPEFIEPVNIALLVVDGQARLVHDDKFAKLECISGQTDIGLLKFWLAGVQEDLRNQRPDAAHLLLKNSAQIYLSEPRNLEGNCSPEIEQILINSYLKRNRKQSLELHRHYIDTLLDEWLDRDLRLSKKGFLHRAPPRKFLSKEVKEHLKSNSFKVSRVYSGKRGLVLLDGLNLRASEETVRIRSQEIGYAYFAMESVRKALKVEEHKELVRASVIFYPEEMRQNPKLEYAVESIRRDSDLVVDPTSTREVDALSKTLVSMSEGELALGENA